MGCALASTVTEGREPSTTCTIRFEPLLRKLRHEEWTAGVEIAPPPPPQNKAAEPKPKPERERGVVVARGSKIGKYELEDKLGHGTFGTVYTARDLELERRVAIKVLNPSHQHNIDVVTRFLQEARATARIKHAGIVTILDCGRIETELGDLAYIVMELLEGETLTRRIDLAERLAAPVAIDICHQIAGALEAAHRADVLHRDVKPDNMFLVRDPLLASGVRVKVLDFGLAKLGRGGHTMVNTILGTPRYMSPEQTRSSSEIDARSDIYALGCILFEMITGRRPFEGDLATLIERHQRAIPARVRTIVPETAPELDDLIACMLAKDPAKRPQTMTEVQRALLEIETETTHVVSRSSIARSAPKPVPKPPPKPAPKLLTKPAAQPEPTRAPRPEPKRPPTPAPVQPPPVEVAPPPVVAFQDHNPRTTVSFPPPPPPASFDAPDPTNVTMIVQPLPPIRKRQVWRRIALGVSVMAVTLALLELLDRGGAPAPLASVEPPVVEPAPVAEPAPPAAIAPTPTAPAASAELTISESEVVAPSIVKLRKQPVVQPRPVAQPRVTRKKPAPTRAAPAPKWDPDALFPNRPRR
jgi:serine/threonine-protein kinase